MVHWSDCIEFAPRFRCAAEVAFLATDLDHSAGVTSVWFQSTVFFGGGSALAQHDYAFARAQESIIVLGIADADDVLGPTFWSSHSCGQSGSFRAAGRDPDGSPVGDDLELEFPGRDAYRTMVSWVETNDRDTAHRTSPSCYVNGSRHRPAQSDRKIQTFPKWWPSSPCRRGCRTRAYSKFELERA
jgi:hypothetical protein